MFGLVVKCLFAGSFLGEVLAEICLIHVVCSVVSAIYWIGYSFSDGASHKQRNNNKLNHV